MDLIIPNILNFDNKPAKNSVWKKVPLCSLLYYLPLTAGYSITMVNIKASLLGILANSNDICLYDLECLEKSPNI